jgi:hypothetical protein
MLVITTVCSIRSNAQGNLLITPMRVVFEGNKQNEEFNLVNTGTDTTTFSISFLQFTMNEDGTMVKSEKPEAMLMSASPYLRIYPSRVTLAPGEPQVIRLQYRRKPNMVYSEYRTHLYFRSEKENRPLGSKKNNSDSTQLTIKLTAIYGLCLPIIIRTNEAKASSTLSDIELVSPQASPQYLKFNINRSGDISTYGDIVIEFTPIQGKSVQLALIRGIGVYPEINKRKMVVKLNAIPGIPLGKGKMKVSYFTNDESKKPVLYTNSELDI